MTKQILVTGGAGFIGSHIVDSLLEKGHRVRVFDSLHPQVHGPDAEVPEYLNSEAEFIKGDVRDYDALKNAMKDADVIFHQAAAVGVGQSMYEIREYCDINVMGTANLLHILANEKNNVRKIIVASSMSIYGEGKYECEECGEVYPTLRSEEQLRRHDWEMKCPECGRYVRPVPTDEKKPLYPTSIYAVNKRDQEEMVLSTGVAYKIPAVALRYFNVYGPRQALGNPYTGVCAIFSSRILNDKSPLIWEDGEQSRDFVHVRDIAQANILAMEKPEADYRAFNVGTGKSVSINQVARRLARGMGKDIQPEYPEKFRAGDIRHCFADISLIKEKLGYEPTCDLEEGIPILIEWAKKQTPPDNLDKAVDELRKKGLAE